MNEGLKQLKELVEEKSVAEVAEKAMLSKASLYFVLNQERPAGKKIRENLFLAYGIPVESWSMEPVVPEPEIPTLKIREGLAVSPSSDCAKCVLYNYFDCKKSLYTLIGYDCGEGKKGAIIKTGEWGPAKPENIAPGDTVRRVERPDLHFTVVTLLKESTTFHNKAVLRPVSESGDDILVDLANFEVYTEV